LREKGEERFPYLNFRYPDDEILGDDEDSDVEEDLDSLPPVMPEPGLNRAVTKRDGSSSWS
jgi:hypothetical protein